MKIKIGDSVCVKKGVRDTDFKGFLYVNTLRDKQGGGTIDTMHVRFRKYWETALIILSVRPIYYIRSLITFPRFGGGLGGSIGTFQHTFCSKILFGRTAANATW